MIHHLWEAPLDLQDGSTGTPRFELRGRMRPSMPRGARTTQHPREPLAPCCPRGYSLLKSEKIAKKIALQTYVDLLYDSFGLDFSGVYKDVAKPSAKL